MRQEISFKAGDYRIPLIVEEDAFRPSTTTRVIAESIDGCEDGHVLDVGCGVGPLSIIAAKKGARKVVGTDIMPKACELARENARINGVDRVVETYCGSLFEPVWSNVSGKADIVILDISGMPEAFARRSGWYPEPVAVAGERGSELYLEAIPNSVRFIRKGGSLYFPVFIDRDRVLDLAGEEFSELERVSEKCLPIPQHMYSLVENGEIEKYMHPDDVLRIFYDHSRPCFRLEIYRAKK